MAFVPTMGALHEGHLSLVRTALDHADVVVASVFVNPLQFNDPSDLERYPRRPQEDAAMLAQVGCDLLFLPDAEDLFAGFGPKEYDLGGLDQVLEGPLRPGHFQGVANVVERLFHYVRPEVALFGEKDRQQLAVIRHVASTMRWPVEIIGVPTVRDPEGLALSSRNQRLSAQEARAALALSRSLRVAEALAFRLPVAEVKKKAWQVLLEEGGVEPEYFDITDPMTLRSLEDWGPQVEAVALVAAQVGPVRLIDNVTLRR